MARVSQEHLDARRKQILDASRRCFIRNGFHATSMQDILSEANLSAGGLYRYFKSKEDILIAVALQVLGSITESIEAGFPADAALTADEVIGRLCTSLEQIDKEQDIARLAVQIWGEAVRSPVVAEHVREAVFDTLNILGPRISAYQAAGTINDSLPPELIARAILGTMPGYLLQRAILGDIDPATFQSAYAALMTPGKAAGA